jgi:hypothetical protein
MTLVWFGGFVAFISFLLIGSGLSLVSGLP